MLDKKYKYIVGVDEVGRGPLAGPVVVGVFCIETNDSKKVLDQLKGITDSKKLSEKKREAYVETIKELQKQNLVQVAISGVSAKFIDTRGIIPAIKSALNNSLEKLNLNPKDCFVYLDGGLHAPDEYQQETIVKGDSKIWQIGAASVVAKVARDSLMVKYAQQYPKYGFEQHKGYGTKKHYEAIEKEGLTDIHRKTWIRKK